MTTTPRLKEIALQIKSLGDQMLGHMRSTLRRAVEIGILLIEAKKAVAHGEFKAWCSDHTDYSYRRCAEFMRVAKSAGFRTLDHEITVDAALKSISGESRERAKPQPWTLEDGIDKTRDAAARLLDRWPPDHLSVLGDLLKSLGDRIIETGELSL